MSLPSPMEFASRTISPGPDTMPEWNELARPTAELPVRAGTELRAARGGHWQSGGKSADFPANQQRRTCQRQAGSG